MRNKIRLIRLLTISLLSINVLSTQTMAYAEDLDGLFEPIEREENNYIEENFEDISGKTEEIDENTDKDNENTKESEENFKDISEIDKEITGKTEEVEIGSTVKLATITKPGFKFLYWENKDTGEEYKDGEEIEVYGYINLKAHWESYILTLDARDEQFEEDKKTITLENIVGEKIQPVKFPENTASGAKITGWETADGTEINTEEDFYILEDQTLFAVCGDSISENSISENSISENSISENSISENSISENSTSENSISENSISENSTSENSISENEVIRK